MSSVCPLCCAPLIVDAECELRCSDPECPYVAAVLGGGPDE